VWVMAWRSGNADPRAGQHVLVRLIQPVDFGIIALAASFMQTIDGMLILGTEEAIIREATPGPSHYDTAFTLNLLRGLLVTALVATLVYPAAGFFAEPRLGPLAYICSVPTRSSGASWASP
ncbi:MAG TPA: oligosaccharide flippase family protein, partial [Rhodopila sp.]